MAHPVKRMKSEAKERKALDRMIQKIDELPLLPQVLVRVMQLDASSDSYFEEFEVLAKEDPTLAVRVVALANSAALAPMEPIVTIKEALARIGTVRVRNLVVALGVQRVFMPTDPNQTRLWRHSVTAAVAAERIAQIDSALQIAAGQAYLVGLLHDIGRFVMFEHASEELLRVDESKWSKPEDLVAADLEIFKYTHSELGYHACKRWGLPDTIAEAVREHHNPIGSLTPGSPEALGFCLQVADRLGIAVLESRQESVESPEEPAPDAEDLERRIVQECIEPVWHGKSELAARLVPAIDGMKRNSDELFGGLGL